MKKLKALITDRPLGTSCGVLMLFTALLLFAQGSVKICVFFIGLLCFTLFLILSRKLQRLQKAFAVLAVLAALGATAAASSFLCYDLYDKKVEKLASSNAEVRLEGYAEEAVYESDYGNCYLLHVDKLNGKRMLGVKILVLFSLEESPALFKKLDTSGTLILPESTDPSFDSRSYYRTKGVFAQLVPDEVTVTEQRSLTLSYPLHLLKDGIKDHIQRYLSDESAALVRAVLIGDKSDLSPQLKRDFKTLGISHLLAVSGLHLSVLFGLWTFLLLKLRIPLKVRSIILLLPLFLFCALCSFSLSVVRAGLMLSVFLLSKIVNEDNDSKTSLLFAGGVIVLVSPYAIMDTGFLLSFFATFGILTASPLLMRKRLKERAPKKLLRTVFNSLIVSLGAQIAVLPILYQTFGSISILSPIATLLFAPLISALLYLAPLAMLLFFVPLLSDLLFFLLERLCDFTASFSSIAVYVKDGLVSTARPLLWIPLLLLILFTLLFLFCEKKKPWAILLCAGYLATCALCFFLPYTDPPAIITETSNKNDLMILYEGGESLVVDLSDGSKKAMSFSLALLNEKTGDVTPDCFFLTHYHQRHLNTFTHLCQNYYPERLYLTSPINQKERTIYDGLIRIAKEHRVKVIILKKDQELSFGDLTVAEFSRAYLKRSTHPILSFEVLGGCHDFTYLSSSGADDGRLIQTNCVYLGIHGPVVKVPLSKSFQSEHRILVASRELGERYELSTVLPASSSKGCCPFCE